MKNQVSLPHLLFGINIFLAAFLLFLVQPLMAEKILPWFGGVPAVWTTCMVFFQSFLFLGYVTAFVFSRYVSLNGQFIAFAGFTVLSLAFADLMPDKPDNTAQNPIWSILTLLTSSVGAPYLILACTTPLLQHWVATIQSARFPYKYFSLSNAASLFALLAYPLLFAPTLGVSDTTTLWHLLYGLYTGLMCLLLLFLGYEKLRSQPIIDTVLKSEPEEFIRTRPMTLLHWVLASALGVGLLLAVTQALCTDVAVVPFLWVAPLVVYLLSFVVCFRNDNKDVHYRLWILIFLSLCITYFALPRQLSKSSHVVDAVGALVALFAGCMICHGDLVRTRPDKSRLTLFYLMISFGGALGGLFVSLLAPRIFTDYYELPLLASAVVILHTLQLLSVQKQSKLKRSHLRAVTYLIGGLVILVFPSLSRKDAFVRSRNFFGILSIREYHLDHPEERVWVQMHGRIAHGMQLINSDRELDPLGYSGPQSGVGRVLLAHSHSPIRIGVVGLGVGALAAYGKEGDYFRFYEINDHVVNQAEDYFTFLKSTPAKVDLVLGDGRLQLENEAPQNFDVLFLDAFSSDAIPMHLLTTEAFSIYLRHLNPNGVIVINITNRLVNLQPLGRGLSEHLDRSIVSIRDKGDIGSQLFSTEFLIMARPEFFNHHPELIELNSPDFDAHQRKVLWTDDSKSLLSVMRAFE